MSVKVWKTENYSNGLLQSIQQVQFLPSGYKQYFFVNMHRIKEEPSAVVCPVIDVIDWNTFEFLGNAGEPQIGGFDWRLVFTWHVVPDREQEHRRSKIDVIRLD